MLLLLCVSCKNATQPSPKSSAARGPQTQATVVTIRTTIGDKTAAHAVVIANNRARSTDEQDAWRLYDLRANTVTFVDDLDKTYRVERLDAILKARRAKLASAMPGHLPAVKFTASQQAKTMHGVAAKQALLTIGSYKRELWIAQHPAIPPKLFAMMQASDPPSTEFAPIARAADEALVTTEGFPLQDRSEVAGIVVDRTVAAIEQKPVAESLLAIPADYKDVTPKPPPATTPGANRRPAS